MHSRRVYVKAEESTILQTVTKMEELQSLLEGKLYGLSQEKLVTVMKYLIENKECSSNRECSSVG